MEIREYVSGTKISEPGVYDMHIDAYHGNCCDGPSASSSGLRTIFSESPRHFYEGSYFNPDRDEDAGEKEAFILGRAAHHLFLGEPDFRKHFTTEPAVRECDGEKWNNNHKECKKWHADRALEGISVLKPKMVESIQGLAKSLEEHPFAKSTLHGHIEKSMFWKDKETGLWMKARPDNIPFDTLDVVDLKTTDSVDLEDIERSIFKWGYHQQGALIREAFREVLGQDLNSFNLLVAEKKAPYCVRVVELRHVDLDLGHQANVAARRLLKRCLDKGIWPGPGGTQTDGIVVGLPMWAENKIRARMISIEREITL